MQLPDKPRLMEKRTELDWASEKIKKSGRSFLGIDQKFNFLSFMSFLK